jgi:hypothetical protein
MEAKWSSLVSYGLSLDALKDFLPIDLSLDVKTVRYDTLKVAKRLEAELGEDQASFIEGEPSDWELLPPPEGSCKVGTLLLDSRVVDLPMSSNPIVVTLSSLKPFFFNGLQ